MPSGRSQFRVGDVGAGATVLQGEKLSIGFTAEQVRALIEASTKGADERIAEISRQLGVTQGAMRTMLATVGQADVLDEKLAEKLAEVFKHTQEAGAAIAALRPDNPVAQAHVADAMQAQACGDRERARRHLRAAREAAKAAADEARRLARQAEAAAEHQMLQAARAAAAEAGMALAGFDYVEAARLFGEAVALVPAGEADEKAALTRRQADTLRHQGDERGDNAALHDAIDIYRAALRLVPRKRSLLDWATTQYKLGRAMAMLGARTSDVALLNEAVAAYRLALQESWRFPGLGERAEMRNNFGKALLRLGERESGTAALEEAVAAFNAAVAGFTKARARTQRILPVLASRNRAQALLDERRQSG